MNKMTELESKFDSWVGDFITNSYGKLNKEDFPKFCEHLENILKQYTDLDYLVDPHEDELLFSAGYEDDDFYLQNESLDEDFDIGDEITYDSNTRGVNPKINKGIIIGKDRSFATKDYPAEDTYKVKTKDGNIVTIDKLMIIENETLD